MTLYSPPSRLMLSASTIASLPETPITSSKTDRRHLYKTISPKKKQDAFGLDQTNYSSYCLSSTIFPTAVKTTLLAELQVSDSHKCGFDIIERPNVDASSSIESKATSIINAPPPTAEHSYRGLGSAQSTAVVTFVDISPEAMIAADRRTSLNSRTSIDTKTNSELHEQHVNELVENQDDETKENKPSENDDTLNKNSELLRTINVNMIGDSRKFGSMSAGKIVMKCGKRKETKKNTAKEPVVSAYSRLDGRRLLQYNWTSRNEKSTEEPDIRDHMYLNTFFPEERPVRFHKSTLPRISRGSRSRPWTVSEEHFRARHSSSVTNKKMCPVRSSAPGAGRRTSSSKYFTTPRRAETAKSEEFHASKLRTPTASGHMEEEEYYGDIEKDKHQRPLLDVRSCLAGSAINDQRDKIKGKDGCLNSRIKQCVRFVRYRERLDNQDEKRPLKSEAGRYRPFSKTDVRDHSLDCSAVLSPDAKLQKSVETYQKYMENIAKQTKLSSPRNANLRGTNPSSSKTLLGGGGTPSSAIDTDSLVVQSIADSFLREAFSGTTSRTSGASPRPQNSALYTKDVSGVTQAMDIKRLSPKILPNRVVAGTRLKTPRTPRQPSASTDEGVEMSDSQMSGAQGAIIVPVVAKSECASEYSVN